MRPFTSTIPFADALARVLAAARPTTRTETVALADADGRVLAEDVTASLDVPAFDRAAMDGYAVRDADTRGATDETPVALTCVGVVAAGTVPARAIGPGECLEVATGAPLPPGATAVVMVEHTSRVDDVVQVRRAVSPGQHVGRRGADIASGDVVVRAGDVLTPARIGALAAVGQARARVAARPSVLICPTGDEVVAQGDPLRPGQVYDVNRYTLAALVGRHGGIAVPQAPAGDTIDALVAVLDAGRAHDVMVFSGGSSVGRRDLLVDAVRARGEVIFHGVAVKPGKPTLFGRVGGVPVLGLSGYPTSCLSNAYALLVPLLRHTARLPPWQPRVERVPLARAVRSVTDLHQIYPVAIVEGRAEPVFKSSGDITSLARADGFIEIPAGVGEIAAGTVVDVRRF
jgi:molybdenum cofactor synthesis domain-containing protein